MIAHLGPDLRGLVHGSISFPVGFAGSFHPDMTGAQNTRFVARIYGADTDAMMAYVEEFAELGVHFQLPVRSYSSGMRSRLSFGVSMALNFDTYLIDEITAVGDAEFQRKSREVFKERMTNAGAIFVSHSIGKVRDMCQAGAVLEAGKLSYYDDIEEAIERHIFNMNGPQSSLSVALAGTGASTDSETGGLWTSPDARCCFSGRAADRHQLVWEYLRRHRSCHFPPTREMHYFDILAGQAEDTLRGGRKSARSGRVACNRAKPPKIRHLAGAGGCCRIACDLYACPGGRDRHRRYIDLMLKNRRAQSVICDITPGYINLAAENFAEMAEVGTARFVVMLRDPVERLWAQICASAATADLADSAALQTCTETAQAMLADGSIAALIEADCRAIRQAR